MVAVDPHPDRPWLPTYAAWVDELPGWLGVAVLRSTVGRPQAWGTRRHVLDRAYGVLDNAKLHHALDISSAHVIRGFVGAVSPGVVTLRDGADIRARRVVDARGLRPDPAFAEQTAFGIVLPAAAAKPALDGADCWFMDWRTDNGTTPADSPSFLYAVPLSDDTVLLEETCLVGRPGCHWTNCVDGSTRASTIAASSCRRTSRSNASGSRCRRRTPVPRSQRSVPERD